MSGDILPAPKTLAEAQGRINVQYRELVRLREAHRLENESYEARLLTLHGVVEVLGRRIAELESHLDRHMRESNRDELQRVSQRLIEAEELLVQADNEWTPTQAPTKAWERRVKRIRANDDHG